MEEVEKVEGAEMGEVAPEVEVEKTDETKPEETTEEVAEGTEA